MTERNKIIELDNEYIMGTYGRLSVVPESGKNSTLYDADGKKYIDFTSGIGVNALGIADEGWIAAVTTQLTKVQHTSNYYYCENASLLAEKLCKRSGLKKVFFGNSGAEANEGAIKLARKYSFDKYGEGRSTIVTFGNSFHGRTVTTLAATGQDVFHNYFFPFTDGFEYAPYNDIDELDKALHGGVCAVMFELIQGEGGVNVMTSEFADALYKLATERDILVINDEVQTGIGRTGRPFAFQKFNYTPDIVTLAKGLGGGLPIGAFLCGDKCSATLGSSMHGSTFGANPVVCAGANEVVDRVFDQAFLSGVTAKGDYIKKSISDANYPSVTEIRGDGLMIGIQISGNPKEVLKKAADKGLLILTAGHDVVRMLPPLTISYEEIDEGLKILHSILSEI